MANPSGKTGPKRADRARNAVALGRWGEEIARAFLKRAGFKVFIPDSRQGHPDLYAQGADGEPLAVEVRVKAVCEITDPASPRFGERWSQRRKKKADRCHHYLWVDRFTGEVTAEPALPTYITLRVR